MTRRSRPVAVLLAEAIHGDDDVLQPLLDTSVLFEAALAEWIRTLLPDAPALHDPEVVRAIRHALVRRDGRAPAPTRGPARGVARARPCARVRVLESADVCSPNPTNALEEDPI